MDDAIDGEEKKDDGSFSGRGDDGTAAVLAVGGDQHDAGDENKEKLLERRRTGCWKDTYAYNTWISKHPHQHDHPPSANSPPPQRHEPIKISGIYSDTLYRSWLCRSFSLDPSWLSLQTVSVERHADLTTELFLKRYEQKNIPVLVKGASLDWPAVRKWKDFEYLARAAGGATTATTTTTTTTEEVATEKRETTVFRATSGAAPLPAKFTMAEYLSYCDPSTGAAEEAPLYLFDRTFAKTCPALLDDFDPALRKSCPYFDPQSDHGHDLLGALGVERRPDFQWIIVGPKRSGSSFHIDPNCTHAWNAPIVGRKRWIFYPPSGPPPPGVHPSPSGDEVAMPVSLGEWFLTYWNEHVHRRSHFDAAMRPLECTAEPGDVLFVPHGWWHAVLNLDDGPGVALTRNYVSASNLGDALRFFDRRVGQISGCRDRRGEAVGPEELGGSFGGR